MSTEASTCPHCAAAVGGIGAADGGPQTCPECGGRLDGRAGTARPVKPRQRPVWVVVPVVGASLAAVAWASVSLYTQLRPEHGWFPPAVEASAGTSAMVARFDVYRPDAAGGLPIVVARPAIDTDVPPGYGRGPHFGSLARLVMEQAVLGAARDDRGWATRVASLGEAPPAVKPELFIEVLTPYMPGIKVRFTVRRGGERGPIVADLRLPMTSQQPQDYPRFVAMAEEYARGPFAEELGKLGYGGRPNAVRQSAGVDGAAEGWVKSLGIAPQFAAVRALHAQARADGESPERLGALVRAYANLGSQTEYQWTTSGKLFKARALLYAQRMRARDPRSPWPLWHRAYALALSGLHRDALVDLDGAQKLAAAGVPKSEAPAWVGLIDAYCHFDAPGLEKAARADKTGLAAYLRFFTTENYIESPQRTIVTAREALAVNPEALNLIDARCRAGGVANSHEATVIGPQALAEALPKRLLEMPGLPADVAALARGGGDVLALRHALDAAGAASKDPAEVSWSVLGRLAGEAQFIQVWRRVAFMHDSWRVPVVDELERAKPELDGHPYRRFVESYGYGPGQSQQALRETLGGINQGDFELSCSPFMRAFGAFDPGAFSMLANLAIRHSDEDYGEMYLAARTLQTDTQGYAAVSQRLQSVSPFSPGAAVVMIDDNWDAARGQAIELERRFSQHPEVLARLATRYGQLGRVDDERRCLEQYNRVSPNSWSYRRLAEVHKEQGRPDLWQATLEEFLKLPDDLGLQHASVEAELAQYFMSQGEFGRATPYAEAAARTGAGWAYECAGQANEGAGEFGRAESFFRAEAERYPLSFMQWFLFCKRTGRGDAAAAARHAEAFVRTRGARMTDNEVSLAILLFDLAGEPAKGAAFIQSLPASGETAGQPGGRFDRWVEQMFLARFADAAGDAKARDAAWDDAAKAPDPAAAKVAALFRQAGEGPLDVKAFDGATAAAVTAPRSASFLGYFAGRYQERHGPIKDAVSLWERCGSVPRGGAFVPLLATNALREGLDGRTLDDSHLLAVRAHLRRTAGQVDQAKKDCDEALRLDPNNREALHTRGLARRTSGDLAGALSDFGEEVDLAPDDPHAHVGKAIALILLGKDSEAAEEIDRAIALAPENGSGYGARGLLELAQGHEDAARKSFGQALKRDPGLGTALEVLKKALKVRPKVKLTMGRSDNALSPYPPARHRPRI